MQGIRPFELRSRDILVAPRICVHLSRKGNRFREAPRIACALSTSPCQSFLSLCSESKVRSECTKGAEPPTCTKLLIERISLLHQRGLKLSPPIFFEQEPSSILAFSEKN
ncbi:hypothetical protein VNO77_20258 [Canavalia gladiata]|uniref:Uncharacterized protein n=1 Tax=Canavalia gladiata TaxID=3824 RepID=A0AAN9LPS8_CANGL